MPGIRRRQRAGWAAALAVLVLGTAAGDAPRPLVLPRHPRVLLFSPHPDDETIAAGGLLHRLVRQGAPVEVVFVTNGDGYPEAVKEGFRLSKPTDTDYVAFGDMREREARAATRRLGLPRPAVRFLGFPDGGLADLWKAHWSRERPYTSPYTKEDSPPYADSVNPDVDYDGQDLTSVMSRELRSFQPTVVLIPHPADSHGDHEHTSYFAIEALSSLQQAHLLPRDVTVLTYLVHHPSWPLLRAPTFDRFLPDPTVSFTTWREIELTPSELAAKTQALAAYRSQLEVMQGFLRHFLCKNELYAVVDPKILAKIASIH